VYLHNGFGNGADIHNRFWFGLRNGGGLFEHVATTDQRNGAGGDNQEFPGFHLNRLLRRSMMIIIPAVVAIVRSV
jgi:hypothetical protein